ncbi:unnamed protein product [Calypogeia fissa]
MAYILKIKYENNLRRLTLQKNEIESESFTFAHLESRIRELFQLPAAAPLAVTYTDEENDVVTMGNDQDLKDALVEQALNPLRIHVTLSKSKSSDMADSGKSAEFDNAELVLKRLLRTLSSTPETVGDTVRHAFQAYEPLFEGVKSTAQIPGLVEIMLQAIVAEVTTAVKNGAAAASGAAAPPTSTTSEAGSGAAPVQPKTHQVPQFGTFGVGPSSIFDGGESSEHDSSSTVHHGVACDICGVSPILGNRWKSKEKFDYDLCHSCYEKHGNEKDYSKIEQPKFRPRHMHGPHRMGHSFHPMGPHFAHPPMGGSIPTNPTHPFHSMGSYGPFHGGRPFGMRGPFGPGGRHHCGPMGPCSGGEKHYARFVCDVTVFDGTEVAPGTQFVKIWRLRNSGTAPWPVNTSLVFVGGDELSHASSVPLEIPEQGLAPEEEMEASVDMVAPEKPGRYVSHWRLASPAGPKFGQRLSVIIQVVPKTTLDGVATNFVSVGDDAPTQEPESFAGTSSETPAEPAAEVVNGICKLNMLPLVNDEADLRNLTVGDDLLSQLLAEPKEEQLLPKEIPSAAAQSGDFGGGLTDVVGNPAIDVATKPEAVTEVGDNFTPTGVAELGVGLETEEAVPKIPEASPAVEEGKISYPVLQVPVPEKQGPITYPVVDTGVIVEPVEGEDLSTTKALLGKLEAMGFTDAKLNAELLEKNGFDLRKTLDDLCAAEEWDPILEELEEMGFYDTVMNRRLMFKNNGSVKRVVKELVQMYRDIQGKREKVE